MGNFDKGGSRGGRPSFGGNRSGGKPSFGGDRGGRPSFGGRDSRGGRDERSTESFKAVCDNCHKSCEVPFRPTSGKPVYCNDCFSKNRDFDSRPSFNSRESAPFSPRNDRPERRDSKPAFSSAPSGADHEGIKKQLEALNVKLETVLRSIEALKNSNSKPAVRESIDDRKAMPVSKAVIKKEAVKKTAPKAPEKKPAKNTAKKVIAKKKK